MDFNNEELKILNKKYNEVQDLIANKKYNINNNNYNFDVLAVEYKTIGKLYEELNNLNKIINK